MVNICFLCINVYREVIDTSCLSIPFRVSRDISIPSDIEREISIPSDTSREIIRYHLGTICVEVIECRRYRSTPLVYESVTV